MPSDSDKPFRVLMVVLVLMCLAGLALLIYGGVTWRPALEPMYCSWLGACPWSAHA